MTGDWLLDCVRIGLGVGVGLLAAFVAVMVAYFVGGGLAALFIGLTARLNKW